MKDTLLFADNTDKKLTGSLLETVMKSYLVRGGTLGVDSTLMVDIITKTNITNGAVKTKFYYGGQLLYLSQTSPTAQLVSWAKIIIQNLENNQSQYFVLEGVSGDFSETGTVAGYTIGEASNLSTVDSTIDQTFAHSAILLNKADTYEVIGFCVRAIL